MKRIILLLCSIFVIAACTVDELNTAFSEPITDQNGVIIDHYPYLWARAHSADSAGTTARIVFKTPDCSLPMFDNGGKVIVGNVYGGITCLETESGNVVWTCKLTDEFFTKPILDYIIASTEEWIILNMDGEFIKVDLKEGKVLARCTIASHAKSRMLRNGDICFYLSGKFNVYRVGCTNLIARVDEAFDEMKIYEHVAVIPYSRNNESYRFIQEVTNSTDGYNVKFFLLSNDMASYDTLFVSLLTKQKNVEYIENIDEYNGEIYLFKPHSFEVFDWEKKMIITENITSNELNYRYHEFYKDRLICHFDNKQYHDDEVIYNIKTGDITGTRSYTCGSKIFDNIKYLPKGNYLRAVDANTQQRLLFVRLIGTNFTTESDSFHEYEAYEHAIGKNAAGRTNVVFATEDLVYCYPGL